MDLISIILPVYNGQKTITKSIESVLSSITEFDTFAFNYELIVVDDGSTDDTWQILQNYQRNNNHVRVFHQENQGCPGARNTGLYNAKGDYITFCDADDWVEPDWLLAMYISLKTTGADFVKYRAIIDGMNVTFNPNEIITWNQYEAKKAFLEHKLLNGILWSCLFRKKCFDGVSFDTSLITYDDSDFMWQILQHVQKVIRVNDAKYHYIVDGDSLSNGRMNVDKVKSAILLWDKIVDSIPHNDTLLKKKACITRIRWFWCSLRGMYRSSISHPQYEEHIVNVIRHSWRDSISSQLSYSDKLAITITILSKNAFRYLFKLYITVQKKMIIRQ